MRRKKKIEANFNILLGVEDLDYKVVDLADSMRARDTKTAILVLVPDPKEFFQRGITSTFVNVDVVKPDFINIAVLSKGLSLFPRIFCLNFDVSDVKNISNILNIAHRHLLDVELFFTEIDRTITEVINQYVFLMKKMNINFYTNEHFTDLESDGSWRFSPGPNVIRR